MNKKDTIEKKNAVSPSRPLICSVAAWDLVNLENHTDLYRVYTLPNGEFLFVGQNSDTIRFGKNIVVTHIVKKAE